MAEIDGKVNPNVSRFLDLLAWSEGTATSPATHDRGYDVIVTGSDGKPEIFTDYAKHPFMGRPAKLIRERDNLRSSASGRYQFIRGTWLLYQELAHVPDFSPMSQDLVCILLLKDIHAFDFIVAGNLSVALAKCASTWASLPGSEAGQNPHELARVMQEWTNLGGTAC